MFKNHKHFLLHSKTSRKLSLLLRSHLHFTNLHKKVFHNGVNSTLSFLRNKYWLIQGRQSIKSLLQQFVTCKYINAKTVTPPAMPVLPTFRLDYNFSYQNIGLDYAGPIYFKNCDHTEKMVKGYFLIVKCCCTHAVHIELTPYLSVKLFLLAFRRFISRCGIPENIISGNLKTFKAVEVQNFMN